MNGFDPTITIPLEEIAKGRILITGGTGSLGHACVRRLLEIGPPERLAILSRDEQKQHAMEQAFQHPALRFFLGDVRDVDRLRRAFRGIDYIIHAAALKHVHLGEYNPTEVIHTNVGGAENVISAAIDQGVKRVVALSTDKAANPINLYGASKLCSDKLFIAANAYSGQQGPQFNVVRYGNVVGSRGSVIPLFLRQRETGVLTVTDERMTRFLIDLEGGVDLVLKAISNRGRGLIYVPKIPSAKLIDLAQTIGGDCEIKTIGIRPGEKLHEVMITTDDSRDTMEFDDCYTIAPKLKFDPYCETGRPVAEDFVYESGSNPWFLKREEILDIVAQYENSHHSAVSSILP